MQTTNHKRTTRNSQATFKLTRLGSAPNVAYSQDLAKMHVDLEQIVKKVREFSVLEGYVPSGFSMLLKRTSAMGPRNITLIGCITRPGSYVYQQVIVIDMNEIQTHLEILQRMSRR